MSENMYEYPHDTYSSITICIVCDVYDIEPKNGWFWWKVVSGDGLE